MQNLLSFEKRTVDHWATVQLFFSLPQVRCFLHFFFLVQEWLGSRNVTAVAHFLKTSERGDSWCAASGFSPLLVKLSQVLESAFPDNLPRLWSSLLHVHLFLTHLFLPVNFLWIYFDTALCEQPALSAMTFCDLPSLWRVSMIFWTTVKSVFPIIVVACSKLAQEVPSI